MMSEGQQVLYIWYYAVDAGVFAGDASWGCGDLVSILPESA